jgi:hypothetical protein
METYLCDIHSKFIRIQTCGLCNNLKEWCSKPNNIYILVDLIFLLLMVVDILKFHQFGLIHLN